LSRNNHSTTVHVTFCIALLLLAGCGKSEHFNDLQLFIKQTREHVLTLPRNKIASIVEPVATTYSSSALRSPFSDAALPVSARVGMHPLNAFALSMLKLVGTLGDESKMWAVILAPDNSIYQVAVGDEIGDRYGKINKIYSDRMEVVEQVVDDAKQKTERIVTLQLKDGS
jgi:type IV pilus assembly protein PilP